MPGPNEVIVVEDEPDLLYLAQKRLKAAGYAPIPAKDGVAAIAAMVDHPQCRKMVTDFMMEPLGGDLWIRFLERFCADWTVVVVSTADIDPGPFFVIPKPVDFENLVTLFERGRA